MQAIGFAILVALVIRYYDWNYEWFGDASRRFAYYYFSESGLEVFIRYLGIPTLLVVMGWQTLSNFKLANQNWKFWVRNISAIVAVFICVPILARILLRIL